VESKEDQGLITRTMVIGDIHIPFEDKKNLELCLRIAEDIKINRLILNGDVLDMYGCNLHGPKHPNIATTLEDEMIAGREFFEKLRKRFPDIEIIYSLGNHEKRLDRFIIQNAKALWGLLTIQNFINFKKLDIKVHPYNEPLQIEKSNCWTQHSPRSYSSAMANLKTKLDQTFIYGCTHREGDAHMTGGSGEVYSSYFNGWLGSATETEEHAEVFSYVKGHSNWQSSLILVTVINEVEFHVNKYSIRRNKVVVDGSLFDETP